MTATAISGQIVRIDNGDGVFDDDTGTLVDPGTITLATTAPDGSTGSYSDAALVHDSTGKFHVDVATASLQPGVWTYSWSSEAPHSYQPGSFTVASAPTTDPTMAADIATIRLRTSGCTWMTDSDLTDMLGAILASDGTPDLWAISAMVMEQYQINNILDPKVGAVAVQSGDARVQYSTSATKIDQLIRRYWWRADPANRAKYFDRAQMMELRPSHRPNLFRRYMGVYPVVGGYPGAQLAAGDLELEAQMFQDFAPLLIQENDL